MIQEAQAVLNHYNFSINDVHHWIWLYRDLWTNGPVAWISTDPQVKGQTEKNGVHLIWDISQLQFTAHSVTLTKCHLCCLRSQTHWKKKYNLSSFHSFSLVHLHLSSYLLYASDRPEGTSTPLTRWSSDGEARGVQQFFSPTLPSSYCQRLLSHKDIWMNQYTHRLGKGSSTPPPFQTHTHHHDPL